MNMMPSNFICMEWWRRGGGVELITELFEQATSKEIWNESSFTRVIFRAVFDSRSSFFASRVHGNACFAGYQKWIIYDL